MICRVNLMLFPRFIWDQSGHTCPDRNNSLWLVDRFTLKRKLSFPRPWVLDGPCAVNFVKRITSGLYVDVCVPAVFWQAMEYVCTCVEYVIWVDFLWTERLRVCGVCSCPCICPFGRHCGIDSGQLTTSTTKLNKLFGLFVRLKKQFEDIPTNK